MATAQLNSTIHELWEASPCEYIYDAELPTDSLVFSRWPTEPVAESQLNFAKLASEWRSATAGLPRVKDKVSHSTYLRIIYWGSEAIPHILADLENSEEPAHWFEALGRITGSDPVPQQDRGNLKRMAEAWIRWGRKKNLTF